MTTRDGLLIGELAARVDLNPKTLRYYEEVGLVPRPERSRSGYRLYRDEDERRLRFVTSARRAGFALGEIKEMLALRDGGEAPCGVVRRAIERRERELERQISDLVRLREELGELAERARRRPGEGAADARYCHILEG